MQDQAKNTGIGACHIKGFTVNVSAIGEGIGYLEKVQKDHREESFREDCDQAYDSMQSSLVNLGDAYRDIPIESLGDSDIALAMKQLRDEFLPYLNFLLPQKIDAKTKRIVDFDLDIGLWHIK